LVEIGGSAVFPLPVGGGQTIQARDLTLEGLVMPVALKNVAELVTGQVYKIKLDADEIATRITPSHPGHYCWKTTLFPYVTVADRTGESEGEQSARGIGRYEDASSDSHRGRDEESDDGIDRRERANEDGEDTRELSCEAASDNEEAQGDLRRKPTSGHKDAEVYKWCHWCEKCKEDSELGPGSPYCCLQVAEVTGDFGDTVWFSYLVLRRSSNVPDAWERVGLGELFLSHRRVNPSTVFEGGIVQKLRLV
jgi:hypothetical protein